MSKRSRRKTVQAHKRPRVDRRPNRPHQRWNQHHPDSRSMRLVVKVSFRSIIDAGGQSDIEGRIAMLSNRRVECILLCSTDDQPGNDVTDSNRHRQTSLTQLVRLRSSRARGLSVRAAPRAALPG